MDKQEIEETKKYIKESKLSKEAKMQLLSLMDFINYPEVKERVFKVLDVEEKLTDLEIRYLKEMNDRFRKTDLFGYNQQSPKVNEQMKQNLAVNPASEQVSTQVPEPSNMPTSDQVQPTTNSIPQSPPMQNVNINSQHTQI